MAQTVCIFLSAADRLRLEAIVSDRNRQRKHIERARVILVSADRGPVQQIAALVGISHPMVCDTLAEQRAGRLAINASRPSG